MKKALKFRSFEDQARIMRIIANPTRLEILKHLCRGPSCASLANEAVKVSQPNLSQHLKALRDAGLVDYRIDGPRRCYFICRPELVSRLFQLLGDEYAYQACQKPEQK